MILETYTCDKCKNPIRDSYEGFYNISHESISGRPIMGDNRISRDVQFCRDCFGRYIAPIISEVEVKNK